MTQEALDKIKKGIKDSNISIHVFNLIMTLVSETEVKIIKKPSKCYHCGKFHRTIKEQEDCAIRWHDHNGW